MELFNTFTKLKFNSKDFENVWIIWSEMFYLKIVTDQVWNHFEFAIIWNLKFKHKWMHYDDMMH